MFRFLSIFLFIFFSPYTFANWQEVNSEAISYWRYVPKKNVSSRSLLIALHGCAQKNHHLKDAGNLEAVAEMTGSILAIPQVPRGGVIAGCWDFYGIDHTSENRYHAALFSMIDELTKSSELGIDTRKVYVSGISSGAGEALVLACLAPHKIAGIALVAGVALGHEARDISKAKIEARESRATCEQLAGEHQNSLTKMKISIIYGSEDRLVDHKHSKLIAEMFEGLSSEIKKEEVDLVKYSGTNPKGVETHYSEEGNVFMSLIENTGLGHAWPSGVEGKKAPFVSRHSIDYPLYLMQFFSL